MAADKAASALESLRDVSPGTSSAGPVGDVEVVTGGFGLRRRRITKMDVRINSKIGLTSRLVGNVTRAPGIHWRRYFVGI